MNPNERTSEPRNDPTINGRMDGWIQNMDSRQIEWIMVAEDNLINSKLWHVPYLVTYKPRYYLEMSDEPEAEQKNVWLT